MNPEIDRYLRDTFFSPDDVPSYEEISEGNINHVYRVKSAKTARTLILKHAETESRISPDIRLERSRGKREADYIKTFRFYLPDALPEVFAYDRKLHLIVMEDMGAAFQVLRSAILGGRRFDFLGRQLGEYVAVTTFHTSDFFLSHPAKKRMQKRFMNPELCDLTERLVFTEPFVGSKENSVSKRSEAVYEDLLLKNEPLHRAAAALKLKFMNDAQALIHGDLHFGSVFVSDRRAVVFDPEFCFFGPIGFDLGNLFAHFLMETVYQKLSKKNAEKETAWLRAMTADLFAAFDSTFCALAVQKCADPVLSQPEFIRAFLTSVLADTAGFAGVECLRRTVGIAKIAEFDRLSAPKRAAMEQALMKAGIALMEQKDAFRSQDDFLRFLDSITV